ncbi:MAG: methyltransferase domain-containing protein [Caldilineaceae bacterium]|nr:methyltransferase domain-containing protein [Caldilineaceae bacterium]
MNVSISHRTQCRICGSDQLHQFLGFLNIPFTDGLVRPSNAGQEFSAPLSIHWCGHCLTVQTLQDVDVTDYYQEYRYTVSHSPTARQFMHELAERAIEMFDLKPGDRVLEIGSGDGYQLECFQSRGVDVLGFEPGAELVANSRARGVPVVEALFADETIQMIPDEFLPAQVVLLTYTFDHLPEPAGFLETIRTVLDPDRGILIIEVHDLPKSMRGGRSACSNTNTPSIQTCLP